MRFPAARCRECGEFLSPVGSRKAAEEAREAHQSSVRKFKGVRHSVTIYESRADWEAADG